MNENNINVEEESLKHRSNAALLINVFKIQKNVELRYDYSSLEILESYINDLKGHIDLSQMQNILAIIGCFLGETFIENFGGKWDVFENSWMIRFNEKNGVFPFNKVFKFYENGKEDSFASMFSSWGIIISDDSINNLS